MEVCAVEDHDALDRTALALRAGSAVIIPTETVYGLAALPSHQDRLLELKGRPASVPIAVLVADEAQAELAAGGPLPRLALRLASVFWPGPLTIVVPVGEGGTLGVRCPDHDFVRALAAVVGPIATTSANWHGDPTPTTAADAAAALLGEVAVVVDGGTLTGAPSSVVDVSAGELVILREGRVPSEAIEAAVR